MLEQLKMSILRFQFHSGTSRTWSVIHRVQQLERQRSSFVIWASHFTSVGYFLILYELRVWFRSLKLLQIIKGYNYAFPATGITLALKPRTGLIESTCIQSWKCRGYSYFLWRGDMGKRDGNSYRYGWGWRRKWCPTCGFLSLIYSTFS